MNTIAEIMTLQPVTLKPENTVLHAARLMDDLNVGALPVCHGGRVLGIVTDRDITVRAIAAGLDPATTQVDVVMSIGIRCCSPLNAAHEVLARMSQVQIRRLPVIDENQRLVGIVSLGDIATRSQHGVDATLRAISTPSEPDRSVLAAA